VVTEDPAAVKVADRLCCAISGKRRYPLQALYHRVVFSLGIRPFVRKKGELYKGVTDKWKELGIDHR